MAAELSARGVQSRHASKLAARLEAITGSGGLEAEILEEMALSLRRAEDKILYALLELELLEKQIDEARRAQRAEELEALVARFNQRRVEARQHVLDLRIQREAIGLRHNEVLATLYPIPPRQSLTR
jgi:hypothetical protein